jgi:ABC-type nitrate/sulfonate/bicarbonate transport system substrate-binding protein
MTMPSRSEQREIRIGMLRLTDAAPLVVATEKGLFRDRELDVRIVVEPSWANIADKLSFGHLDAAVMLPPLALAMALGLRGTRVPVTVAMGISLNGNSVTVSHKIADAIGDDGSADAMDTGRCFRAWLTEQRARPRLAVVHIFSTHNFLLRYWLAAAGIDPDADVEICTLPPSDTEQALRAGEIDGFCAVGLGRDRKRRRSQHRRLVGDLARSSRKMLGRRRVRRAGTAEAAATDRRAKRRRALLR